MKTVGQIPSAMNARPNIVSVCRALPTPGSPNDGLFVLRRLEAMARKSDLSVLQPIPYFPFVRPLPYWAETNSHQAGEVEIVHAPMPYIPRFFKSLDGFWLYQSIYDLLAQYKLRNGLDAIDAHFGYPDGVGCIRAGRKLGVPVFITVRGFEVDVLKSSLTGNQLLRAISDSSGCICVSYSLQNTLIEAGVDTTKTRVIHNAVDRRVFRPQPKLQARKTLGLASQRPLVVSVGNLLRVKRHDVLIEAFARVLSAKPDAHLVIIGGAMHEPDYPQSLRILCEKLGVSGSVTFSGKLPASAIVTWLGAADVFALASEREGCSNALLEALACGLPAVVTSVGDNDYFVKSAENGYLVPVNDSKAFSHSLNVALERQDWESDDISSGLDVGNWDAVASQVFEFMAERTQIQNGVVA